MASVDFNIQIVINTSYGGFFLSDAAATEIAQRKGWTFDRKSHCFQAGPHGLYARDIPRNDPDLIFVVRKLGSAAGLSSGDRLEIKTVAVSIAIDDYDGKESIGQTGAYATD